jgi:hypothetical protein
MRCPRIKSVCSLLESAHEVLILHWYLVSIAAALEAAIVAIWGIQPVVCIEARELLWPLAVRPPLLATDYTWRSTTDACTTSKAYNVPMKTTALPSTCSVRSCAHHG